MNSGPDITEKINDSTDTYLMRLYFTMLFLNISVNAIRNVERLPYGIRHLIPEDRHGLFTDAGSAEFLKLAQKKNLSKQDIQSIFDDTVIRFCICEYVEILTSCLEKAYRSYVLYLEMHKKSEKNQTRKLESVFHKSTLPRKVEILDSIGFFEKDSELKNYLQNIYDIRNAVLHRDGFVSKKVEIGFKTFVVIKEKNPDKNGGEWVSYHDGGEKCVNFDYGDKVKINLADISDILDGGIIKIVCIIHRGMLGFPFDILSSELKRPISYNELPISKI